jgi:hypothetical protein
MVYLEFQHSIPGIQFGRRSIGYQRITLVMMGKIIEKR